jgi:hypothetical protein
MITNNDITDIFNSLTIKTTSKYSQSIAIKKNKYNISYTHDGIMNVTVYKGDTILYKLVEDKDTQIKIYKNKIDLYNISEILLYQNTEITDINLYTVYSGFILNKHIVYTEISEQLVLQVYKSFTLHLNNPINLINLCIKSDGLKCFFVFDIEDTRETFITILNQLRDQHIFPSEIVENIGLNLGCTKYDGTYKTTQFPLNFISKYKHDIPSILIKPQLKKLYEMGIIKMACMETFSTRLNLLTNDAYDYIYPNGQPNKITKWFSSKKIMQEFIDKQLKLFFNE